MGITKTQTISGGPPLTSGSPGLRLTQEQMKEIGEIVADGIRENILAQRQADGSPLKGNAPSTIESKIKRGLPTLSLADEGRRLLLRTSYIVKGARNRIEIRLSGAKRKGREGSTAKAEAPSMLAQYTQEAGYRGWFGASQETLAAVREYLRELIRSGGK